MQKRNVLNSPHLLEFKKKRQRVVLNKILFYVFTLFIISALLAYISRIDRLNISEIEISGNKVIDTEMIQTVVEQAISENYFWVFPKTNILYYPQNSIRNELYNKFKRLKDISFSIENKKILEVSVTERVALYTWCGEKIELEEKCYFMDENGFVFDEAPYFSGGVYFKFYGLIQNFQKLIFFKETLENMELKPVALYITNDGDIEVFLSRGVLSVTGPKIIFKMNADFQNVAENLEAALTTPPLQSEFKNKYSSLLYIDLRFGNKVYYKFQ